MYRNLYLSEIEQLLSQHCTCEDWQQITVSEGFEPKLIRNVRFAGAVQIGRNVRIEQVRRLANYRIEHDAVIDNVSELAVSGSTAFGNGTAVSVLNETGGREVLIHNHLSAQSAYIQAMYRHRPTAVYHLHNLIKAYAIALTSELGTVGKSAQITNCQIIKNVNIGAHARINSALRLTEGSINSCAEAPAHIGAGVIAEQFIAAEGSRIENGAMLSHCYIGQATHIGKQFSAENSLFFANCQAFHGEACALFAAPYTVTHHKSTLLIGIYTAFLNAGSNSNQSNHAYKLGAVHQGVLERGSKLASSSYLLLPAHIGAFTMVMGRHYSHPDISDLPFSYLMESGKDSLLFPAYNLTSAGTLRDSQKWSQRDLRQSRKVDQINFELLNPYSVGKMMKGLAVLERLRESSDNEIYDYRNVRIKKSSLLRGIRLYRMAIAGYWGEVLAKNFPTTHGLQTRTSETDSKSASTTHEQPTGTGDWADIAGLLAPKSKIERLLETIESGEIADLNKLQQAFEAMHANYDRYEWAWSYEALQKQFGALTPQNLIYIIKEWQKNSEELNALIYNDLKKEFSETSRISSGIDRDETERDANFEQVRGTFETNEFAQNILNKTQENKLLAKKLIEELSRNSHKTLDSIYKKV